jgi:DNA-binding transcriptional MerR regulator
VTDPTADPSTPAGEQHLAIGEVLALLKDEFPDASISKIRFLESQGLIAPERTASGYRVFYEADVQRLRWILHQQREYFLPLKVIKERLDEHGPGAPPSDEPAGAIPVSPRRARTAARADEHKGVTDDAATTAPPATPRRKRRRQSLELPFDGFDDATATDGTDDLPALGAAVTHEDDSGDDDEPLFDRAALLAGAGIDENRLNELEAYGLVVAVEGEGMRAVYDLEAVAVARAAAGFFRHGIEARHIKMYQHFAEREAALFAQVLLPFLRQRNPAAHARFEADLADLARTSRTLRGVLLYRAARESLTE